MTNTKDTSINQSWKLSLIRRILIALGRIAGIIAIVLGVIPILQTVSESARQDRVDATVIAIQQEQLGIMKEITTLQATDHNGNYATVTAISRQLTDLKKTATALEVTQLEGTLTALEQEKQILVPTLTKTPFPITETPTPQLIPSNTPIPIKAYYPVPIENIANSTLDFESPNPGKIQLGGVEFSVAARVFKSQASIPPHDTFPTSVSLATNIFRAYRMHLLINVGNGYTRFENKSIGQIRIKCDNEWILVTELHLGREVREWHAADNVVSTAYKAIQVWNGKINDFPNLVGYIDLLSVELPDKCQYSELTAIEIMDISSDTVNSLDPALNLVGLTIEYYK